MVQRDAFGGKEDEDEEVHDLMKKTHEGKKSPWKKAMHAAQGNPIDWATLNQAVASPNE